MTQATASGRRAPRSATLALARLRARAWPFRTLPHADRLFAGVAAPCVLERPFFGFRLSLDVSRSNGQGLLFLEGERFLPERGLLRSLARPGFRVVDVGANIGYYMLLWERLVGPSGFIHCLEPDPDNLVELARNAERNRLRNVELLAMAAGADDGSASLRPGVNATVEPRGQGDLTVPLRRLDGLIRLRTHLLKVDVEGYEGEVLAGAQRLIERDRPFLFVEVHPWRLYPPHSVGSLVASLRPLYGHIDAYEAAGGGSVFHRAAVRYGARAPARRLELETLDLEGRAAPRERPFWLVCRP